MSMQHLLIALVCLAVLLKASEVFIDQVSAIAKRFRINSFLVGFTIVSIGTALPDLVISTYSASQGNPDFAIATSLGSGIINISLLLGVLGIITRYKLQKNDLENNIPITIFATVCFIILLLLFGGRFTWVGGLISLALFSFVVMFIKKQNHIPPGKTTGKFNLFFLLLSFLLLALSGKYTSDSFLKFADYFNLEDSIIGFLIVGVGISIPELVASLQAIKKGNLQLSLGNILGAFLINILAIPAICSFFTPLNFQPYIFTLIYIFFSLVMFLLFGLMGKEYYISKKEGTALIFIYLLFLVLQFFL